VIGGGLHRNSPSWSELVIVVGLLIAARVASHVKNT
jgi:hypothetical protein